MHNTTSSFFVLLLISTSPVYGQDMSLEKLGEVIEMTADSIKTNGSSWQFTYKSMPFVCIADANANRMRIISPIVNKDRLDEELLLNALVANFHTALDVKYALSDDILWSVYLHPLKELTEGQVVDAISQVYFASLTFGTTYSSTSMFFPGNRPKEEDLPLDEKEKTNPNKL